MTEPRYCDCHLKHVKSIEDIEKDMESCSTRVRASHQEMWDAIKAKMPITWLWVMIPVIMAWIGFQLAMYDSMKTVEMKVAVIQSELKTYINGVSK